VSENPAKIPPSATYPQPSNAIDRHGRFEVEKGMPKIYPLEALEIFRHADKVARHLTTAEKRWLDEYLRQAHGEKRPSAASVARALGISRQLSARIQRKIFAVLAQIYTKAKKEDEENQILDRALECIRRPKSEVVKSTGPYLERTRGDDTWRLWVPKIAWDEDLGRPHMKDTWLHRGWELCIVQESEAKKLISAGIRLRQTTTYLPSPGQLWWQQRAKELSREQGIGFSEAYRMLRASILERYANRGAEPRFCPSCGTLLPLGENLDGSAVTIRRTYCSAHCRVHAARH